jgi:luciferase family oxidoreductase group 1
VHALPRAATAPQLWMLGSSGYGAQLAAHLGMPYAFAHFIAEDACEEALAQYRHAFRAGWTAQPEAAICVWALAADTEEEAWRLFASRERTRLDRNLGRFGPLLPPEEAERPRTAQEEGYCAELRAKALVGSAAQVADKLRALAAGMQVDQVAVITWTWDARAQRRSYELLAREFGLGA